MEIAQQENIPISHCNDVIQSPSSTLFATNLEEELLQDNRNYIDNIELGKQINTIIDKGQEVSLSKHRKYALDLYQKKQVRQEWTPG